LTAHAAWQGTVADRDTSGAKRRTPQRPRLSADFKARVPNKTIDLVRGLNEEDLELEFLPGSDNMLVRGGRHLLAAPAKTGKSLTTQVHSLQMVQRGARVIVLDKENGKHVYLRRLQSILGAWGNSELVREAIRKRLYYVEHPHLRSIDGPELTAWAMSLEADLVVFDAQRNFLDDLGLKENEADDMSKWQVAAINPLFEAGIATLMLDNTGYGDSSRARGSSVKRDLNEIIFTLAEDQPFTEDRKGRARLTLPPGSSRLGNQGEWTMTLGGGVYEEWHETGSPRAGGCEAEQLILRYVRENPNCSKTKAANDCTGDGEGKGSLEAAISALIASGELVADERKRGKTNATYLRLP
jgi:hypothetical protein